jgi:hypothetical protein
MAAVASSNHKTQECSLFETHCRTYIPAKIITQLIGILGANFNQWPKARDESRSNIYVLHEVESKKIKISLGIVEVTAKKINSLVNYQETESSICGETFYGTHFSKPVDIESDLQHFVAFKKAHDEVEKMMAAGIVPSAEQTVIFKWKEDVSND